MALSMTACGGVYNSTPDLQEGDSSVDSSWLDGSSDRDTGDSVSDSSVEDSASRILRKIHSI